MLGHLGAETILPASYAATPTSIKSAPAWLGAKGVHAAEHQLHNVPHALEKGKGVLEGLLHKEKPTFSGDNVNQPQAGDPLNTPIG
jgi:hypothetical protein